MVATGSTSSAADKKGSVDGSRIEADGAAWWVVWCLVAFIAGVASSGGAAVMTVAAVGGGGVTTLGGGVTTFVADGVVIGGLVTQQPHRHGHMAAGGDGGGDGLGNCANDGAGVVASFFSSIVSGGVMRSRLYHTPPTHSNTIKPQNVMSKPYNAFTLERVTSSFLYA